MQVAVPKSQKLKLDPLSSSNISVGEEATQILRITATQGVSSNFGFTTLIVGSHPAKIKVDISEGWQGIQ